MNIRVGIKNMICKHKIDKNKCEKCFDEKFGQICRKCGLRRVALSFSSGHNLPKSGGGCNCK